jgi:hypothetical protein
MQGYLQRVQPVQSGDFMTGILRRVLLTTPAGILVLAVSSGAGHAQIFCPTTIPNPGAVALAGGNCTNGNTGAFSNAALGSQALSDLAQSSTQATTDVATKALAERRDTEQQSCPAGTRRVGGSCQTISTRTEESPARRPPRPRPSGGPREVAPVYKAPVVVVEPSVRYATWGQAFGDYERRTGTNSFVFGGGLGAPGPAPGTAPVPMLLSGESRATLGGFLGGADLTMRNGESGIIAGLLGGFQSSHVRVLTSSASSNQAVVGNGSSTLAARLNGGSAGAYVTFFKGAASIEATYRADFLTLHESFSEVLAFTGDPNGPPTTQAPFFVPFSASGATNLINSTFTGNVNYRVPLSMGTWVEPTAGVQYTDTHYDSSAAALGLANGHLLRVQAGARYGTDFVWGNALVTASLTGLIYENVTVSGGFIQNVAFGNNALIFNDQGKLRGEGIAAVKFDYGNGFSTFAQANVRGGEGLFGFGGKGGVRYEWSAGY